MSYLLNDEPTLHAWAVCDDCGLSITVKALSESEPFAPEADWEAFGLQCPVCGNTKSPEGLSFVDEGGEDDE